MPIPASAIDLTTVDLAKYQIANFSSTNQADNDILQIYITAFSQYFVNRTGVKLAPTVGSPPIIASPFNAICQYTDECYDGNGSDVLYLDNTPIQAVQQLVIGSFQALASSGVGSAGYFVERDQKSLAFRCGQGGVANGGYVTSTGSPWAVLPLPQGQGQHLRDLPGRVPSHALRHRERGEHRRGRQLQAARDR